MRLSGSALVHDVAALLIERQHARGRPIDKMQLQKLLYLVQQSHIALVGSPAFEAEFRAYANGPVIEQVESTYRDLTVGASPLPRALGGHPEQVDEDVAHTVEIVLEHFGAWPGRNLESFVKRPASPWRKARGDTPMGAKSRAVIPLRDIALWAVTHTVEPNPPKDRLASSGTESDEDAWFWSEGWLEGEREADADIAAGRVDDYDDVDSLLADMG